MKNMSWKLWRAVFVLGSLCLITVGPNVLSARPAAAAVRPLCGPTRLWDCTLPNGKHTTVAGTVCEIDQYEQKKRAVCVPSGQ